MTDSFREAIRNREQEFRDSVAKEAARNTDIRTRASSEVIRLAQLAETRVDNLSQVASAAREDARTAIEAIRQTPPDRIITKSYYKKPEGGKFRALFAAPVLVEDEVVQRLWLVNTRIDEQPKAQEAERRRQVENHPRNRGKAAKSPQHAAYEEPDYIHPIPGGYDNSWMGNSLRLLLVDENGELWAFNEPLKKPGQFHNHKQITKTEMDRLDFFGLRPARDVDIFLPSKMPAELTDEIPAELQAFRNDLLRVLDYPRPGR